MVTNAVGFSRLKNIFRSGINFENYSQIVGTAKNQTVGNLPADMIKAIKSNGSSVAPQIQKVKEGFSDASDILKEFDTLLIDSFEALPIHTELGKKLLAANLTDRSIANEISVKMAELRKTSILPWIEQLQNKASQALHSKISGILPPDAQVKITYLDSGLWGNGYKVEFLDSAGNKVLKDRALKVFKGAEGVTKRRELETTTILESIASSPDETFREVAENAGASVRTWKINYLREQMNREILQIKANNSTIMQRNSPFHSASAEANSTMFIKRGVGHSLNKTDAINHDMFDMKNGYCIAPFSDSSLQKITSELNFAKLGLVHTDVNAANKVEGRIVDFGGITVKNEALMDSTVLKYYKKIMNRTNPKERMELIHRYQELAENPKTPLRNKIQEAVRIAKDEVPPNLDFEKMERNWLKIQGAIKNSDKAVQKQAKKVSDHKKQDNSIDFLARMRNFFKND